VVARLSRAFSETDAGFAPAFSFSTPENRAGFSGAVKYL